MGQILRRLETRIRCLLGHHELVANALEANGKLKAPARLRLRCLHCRAVTPGWDTEPDRTQERPGYRRTHGPDLETLTLPNPRLAAIEARERAAEPVAVGGSPTRRNVAKFPLARKGRLR